MKIGVIRGLIVQAQASAVCVGRHQRITKAGIRMATIARLTQRVSGRISSLRRTDPSTASIPIDADFRRS